MTSRGQQKVVTSNQVTEQRYQYLLKAQWAELTLADAQAALELSQEAHWPGAVTQGCITGGGTAVG
jgi:hypothetical protein